MLDKKEKKTPKIKNWIFPKSEDNQNLIPPSFAKMTRVKTTKKAKASEEKGEQEHEDADVFRITHVEEMPHGVRKYIRANGEYFYEYDGRYSTVLQEFRVAPDELELTFTTPERNRALRRVIREDHDYGDDLEFSTAVTVTPARENNSDNNQS